jgi:hypothetical protein
MVPPRVTKTSPCLASCPHRRWSFIQRLRGHIAAFLAAIVTVLSLGRIRVDPSGTALADRGRQGVAKERREVEEEPPSDG